MEIHSYSPADTEAAGETLGKRLKANDVVALFGELGAGKTAFVRGAARALSVKGRVTSPTFAIVNEYKGSLPVYHFDLYRLNSAEELFDIGWEDYLDAGGVTIVEWSERIEGSLPAKRYDVSIKADGEGSRIITITERGDKYENTCL
ncbi:MAG: tRNA (adenosine(37)-N6)-threonylcarbamoyltransferase complex ATPase subunit type 1 TsaE [Bacillota bacterium]|nr:tRNA (adenosine(37)-N6)-threonylcarbamoyltransferase complex ATPase subunit type 1 TsaE [Bacillota bacterium]